MQAPREADALLDVCRAEAERQRAAFKDEARANLGDAAPDAMILEETEDLIERHAKRAYRKRRSEREQSQVQTSRDQLHSLRDKLQPLIETAVPLVQEDGGLGARVRELRHFLADAQQRALECEVGIALLEKERRTSGVRPLFKQMHELCSESGAGGDGLLVSALQERIPNLCEWDGYGEHVEKARRPKKRKKTASTVDEYEALVGLLKRRLPDTPQWRWASRRESDSLSGRALRKELDAYFDSFDTASTFGKAASAINDFFFVEANRHADFAQKDWKRLQTRTVEILDFVPNHGNRPQLPAAETDKSAELSVAEEQVRDLRAELDGVKQKLDAYETAASPECARVIAALRREKRQLEESHKRELTAVAKRLKSNLEALRFKCPETSKDKAGQARKGCGLASKKQQTAACHNSDCAFFKLGSNGQPAATDATLVFSYKQLCVEAGETVSQDRDAGAASA